MDSRAGVSGLLTRAGPTQKAPVRILIVDDSLTARNVFLRLFEGDMEFEIVGQASRAERALEMLSEVSADVLLLDLEMPGIGGLAALPKLIEASNDARILIVSALSKDGAELTLQALSLGAADTIAKPANGMLDRKFQDEMKDKVRNLGKRRAHSGSALPVNVVKQRHVTRGGAPKFSVVAIGGSTGGIHALCQLLRRLPPKIGMPILVTQHLPSEFMEVFARQLAEASGREAQVAKSGIELVADGIVIAPGDAHLTVKHIAGRLYADLKVGRADNGYLPSVDVMLSSLGEATDVAVTAVLLSGMGKDGLIGARKVAAAGGVILAQDEESSAVWGMPRAVVDDGLASIVLPPEKLGEHISIRLAKAA